MPLPSLCSLLFLHFAFERRPLWELGQASEGTVGVRGPGVTLPSKPPPEEHQSANIQGSSGSSGTCVILPMFFWPLPHPSTSLWVSSGQKAPQMPGNASWEKPGSQVQGDYWSLDHTQRGCLTPCLQVGTENQSPCQAGVGPLHHSRNSGIDREPFFGAGSSEPQGKRVPHFLRCCGLSHHAGSPV